MFRRYLSLLCLIGVTLPAVGHGASDWSKVKPGLTPEQALDALGVPMMRRYNRGIDVWIYDSMGEVVFAGGTMFGWSLPTANPESEARSVETDVVFRSRRRLPSVWKSNNSSSTITAKSQAYTEPTVYWGKN